MREGLGLGGWVGSPKERGIKIFSVQNEVTTKYPPGERARGDRVCGKDRLGEGKANVSKGSM